MREGKDDLYLCCVRFRVENFGRKLPKSPTFKKKIKKNFLIEKNIKFFFYQLQLSVIMFSNTSKKSN